MGAVMFPNRFNDSLSNCTSSHGRARAVATWSRHGYVLSTGCLCSAGAQMKEAFPEVDENLKRSLFGTCSLMEGLESESQYCATCCREV